MRKRGNCSCEGSWLGAQLKTSPGSAKVVIYLRETTRGSVLLWSYQRRCNFFSKNEAYDLQDGLALHFGWMSFHVSLHLLTAPSDMTDCGIATLTARAHSI